jgi:hypothetical protein
VLLELYLHVCLMHQKMRPAIATIVFDEQFFTKNGARNLINEQGITMTVQSNKYKILEQIFYFRFVISSNRNFITTYLNRVIRIDLNLFFGYNK